MAQKMAEQLGKAGRYLVALGVAMPIFNSALYNVDAGERVLIFDRVRGVREKLYNPGTHFRIPILQDPIKFDVRTTHHSVRSVTGSKDLQQVSVTLRVLYKPQEEHIPNLFQEIGMDYADKILPSVGNEVLKAVIAQFNANELVTQRDIVSAYIRERLTRRAEEFGLTIEDVAITHLTFSKEYLSAIENKQVAQQEAERAKFLVQKAEQEKLAKVIVAEGEAESAQLIADAMQSGPGFIMLRKIEAAKDIAEMLARSRNVVYLPGTARGGNNSGNNGGNTGLLLSVQ